jgi:hypothetical protein
MNTFKESCSSWVGTNNDEAEFICVNLRSSAVEGFPGSRFALIRGYLVS